MFALRPPRLIALGALSLGAALLPAPARACSYGTVVVQQSFPSAGAAEVPTNAVLFVYGPRLEAERIVLRDSNDAVVATEVRAAVPSGFDVVPLAELEPGQSYRLVVTAPPSYSGEGAEPLTQALAFTTGSGPAAVPDHLDVPSGTIRVLDYEMGSCDEESDVCVDVAPQSNTTLEIRVGQEVLFPPEVDGQPAKTAYGHPLAENACVELRARDVRGNRSAPLELCGANLERVRLRPVGLTPHTCDNYAQYVEAGGSIPPVTPDAGTDAGTALVSAPVLNSAGGAEPPASASSGGCSLNGFGAAPGGGALLLGTGALFAARLRRRGR